MVAKKHSNTAQENTGEKPARFFDRALKWVTAITAVISLFFAVQKVTQTVADNSARTQQIAELLRVASMQQQAMDYSRAWDSLEKAAQLSGSGDALAKLLDHHEADIAKVRNQREDLAMAWLDNIRVPEGKSFTDAVDKLLPVLEAGTANAEPQHKADLIAHIGWSYFLRSRDGNLFDPTPHYTQAIALDSLNPFAHAYWGHWMTWQGESSIDDALGHFNQALQSGRERKYVRHIELIALNNASERAEPEFIGVEIEMLRNSEALSDDYRTIGRRLIENACSQWGQSDLAALKKQISNADLSWIYTQLTDHTDADEQKARNECLAKFK